MRKILVLGIALVLAGTGVGAAHDYSTDLFCKVDHRNGQSSTWAFANTSANADESYGGTMV